MTKVAALLMAAGNSRRMGGPNKLLLQFQGQPLLSFAIKALQKADLAARILVTGRDQTEIQKFRSNLEPIHNPNFESGFGSSLGVGFSALLDRPEVDGALVMLGDMPVIRSNHLNQLIETFAISGNQAIIRAAHKNQPGNPVIIPKALFGEMAKLDGEQSGQSILKTSGLPVKFVEIGPAALADIDTPEALAALQGAIL